MEVAEAPTPMAASLRPRIGRSSPSFRLHSPSLNSLRLRRVFDLFDHNGDGEITVEELSLALDRLDLGADPVELTSIVSAYIRPGRSGLDFHDFEGFHRDLGNSLFGSAGDEIDAGEEEAAEGESYMEEAFRVFDEDGDGYISAAELQVVLSKLGLPEARCISRVQANDAGHLCTELMINGGFSRVHRKILALCLYLI